MTRYAIPFAVAVFISLCFYLPAEHDEDPRTKAALEWVKVLERLDVDRDGQLTDLEVPLAAKDVVRRMAKDAGLDAALPISVSDLRDGITAQRARGARETLADVETNDFARLESQFYVLYDENLDGVIDVFELESMTDEDRLQFDQVRQLEQLQSLEWLRHLDLNSDGIIQSVEVGLVSQVCLENLKSHYQVDLDKQPRLDDLHAQIKGITGVERKQLDRSSYHDADRPRESDYQRQTRLRMYAANLIAIYDQNEDGSLVAAEWRKISTTWGQYDRNQDGLLSTQEVSEGLRIKINGKDVRSSQGTAHIDSGILRRLPDGLPEWFLERDFAGNSDGQVQMVEFTEQWNDELLGHFHDLDTNDDGVIEPRECLRERTRDGD